MHATRQLSLFDADRLMDDQQAASVRLRMREMINRLRASSLSYWRDQTAVTLDDGAWQRAMRLLPLLPLQEAQTFWAEFDEQMERLYAMWAEADPPYPSGNAGVVATSLAAMVAASWLRY